MSRFDDFVGHLEAALGGREGHEAFADYLLKLTPAEMADLLAEAERRDPEGAAELARAMLNPRVTGGPRKARGEKASKTAGKKSNKK